MMPTEADASPHDAAPEKTANRSPLAQLLHALNQPLTGLQCSMEVALARPRTIEQYVQGLRQGLELTERMRALVEAIREVAELGEGEEPQTETTELASLLREAVDDLRPVAEVKKVRIVPDFASASSLRLTRQKSQLARVIFRLLDSTLSMAAAGTALRIETGSGTSQVWVRIQWQAEAPRSALSRPELGLFMAQAWLERVGGEWEREATDDLETLNVRLPCVP
jgi:signal transduction histidine kinase